MQERGGMTRTEALVIVGVAVALINGEETQVNGYGSFSRDSKQRPDGNTVFDIGSVTKTFTTLLLADLVEHGRVSFDDPVQKFLPESVTVPRKGDRKITLIDLATHTSSLPRMPTNFEPKDPNNPYADYTVGKMYEFLSPFNYL